MKIQIDDNREIATIQEEFNKFFPYLKLDFFGGGNEYQTFASIKAFQAQGKKVKELRTIHTEGVITLFREMSVSDLEKIFNDGFGISVHILRKAGNSWLKTSHTDSWSLDQQNKQGMLITADLFKQEQKRNKL